MQQMEALHEIAVYVDYYGLDWLCNSFHISRFSCAIDRKTQTMVKVLGRSRTLRTMHSVGTSFLSQNAQGNNWVSSSSWLQKCSRDAVLDRIHSCVYPEYADGLDGAKPPNLELPRSFVINGAQVSGVKDWSLSDRLFHGRTQLAPGHIIYRPYLQVILRKWSKRQKSQM